MQKISLPAISWRAYFDISAKFKYIGANGLDVEIVDKRISLRSDIELKLCFVWMVLW